MDLESRLGQTEPNTLENGERTKLKEKETLFMWTEMCMMASGLTTKPMATVSTNMSMEPCTKENGKMIYSMEKV